MRVYFIKKKFRPNGKIVWNIKRETFFKEKVVKLQKSVGYKVKAFITLEFDKKPYILGYIFGGD